MSIELFNEDCIETMKRILDGSIDLMLTDPPYGITANQWDITPNLPLMWNEWERILKPNGVWLFFCQRPFTADLIVSRRGFYKYCLYWDKIRPKNHLNAKKQPMRDKEDVLVFYKKQCTYNPQWTWGEPYTSLKSGKTAKPSTAKVSGKYMNGAEYRNGSDGRRYPKQVQEFGVVERGTIHPTQKPVDLFRYFIRTYTNEGELVLDNTAGSGTTAIACLEEKRQFIVIEQDPNYFIKIKKRVADFNKIFSQGTLFDACQ